MNIKAYFPNYFTNAAMSYVCSSICNNMRSKDVRVDIFAQASNNKKMKQYFHAAISRYLHGIIFRIDKKINISHKISESVYLRQLKKGDVAYIWPGLHSESLYKKIKDKGCIIVQENTNCHMATAKRILDHAYAYLGWPIAHRIIDEMIAEENADHALADFVYASNKHVERSLLENGVPAGKILLSSYGWAPDRFNGTNKALPSCEGITFIFMGTLCVRKGVPLLLDIWRRANIKGRLVLVGGISSDVARYRESDLKRSDIVYMKYTPDAAAYYRSSDVFVFPSLEEGGPLVTVEAMAHRLPVIVSPMGTGAYLYDEKDNAMVCDPYDQNMWVEAMRKVAYDAAFRKRSGKRMFEKAQMFTWDKVASRRMAALRGAIK